MSTTIEETITVATPVEEAFTYVADFANVAQWDPGVASSARRDAGPVGLGSVFDVEVVFGRSRVPMVYEITEFDRPNRVVLVGRGEKLTAVDTVEFTTTRGGTEIRYEANLEFSNFVRFLEPFMGRVFDNVGRKAMAGLQDRLS